MEFNQKICVVTGGANGIGRCIAESFLDKGAFVAVIDTDENAGNALCQKYPKGMVFFYHGDLSDEKILIEFSNQVLSRFHQVDYLINNAGISKKGILSDCSLDDFNAVLRLGITAPYYLSKAFLPFFRENASIVNISSSRVIMSQPDTESYTAAKGGITALTHALCVSLAGKVRVNAISPGWIDTAAYHLGQNEAPSYEPADLLQHPAGRIGKPKDIAEMVLFLCSEKSGFITGQNFVIDGGMTKQMIYHHDCGWSYDPDFK